MISPALRNGRAPSRRVLAASILLAATSHAALAGPANVDGAWTDVAAWPRIPVHAALLPDGKVVTYGATPQGAQGGFDIDIWDPKLGVGADAHLTLPNGIDVDSFCANQVLQSWSGNLLVVGGSTNAGNTSTLKTSQFSYQTRRMTALEGVKYPRWYSTVNTLPDGRIIVHGGVVPYADWNSASMTPEVYTPGQGWRELPGAYYPREQAGGMERRYWFPRSWPVAGNKIFVLAGKAMYQIGYDGNGSIGNFQTFDRPNWGSTGSAVMYAPKKVLQIGGGAGGNDDPAPAGSKGATTIDISAFPYKVADTGTMRYGRHWPTATLLANGEVLATGGSEGNNGYNYRPETAAYAAEIWNPATGQWRLGASMKIPRLYHSTALLLPDGRVLSGGGGAPGPVMGNNAEIYSPPYLFADNGQLAERPVLASEPGIVRLGQSITVKASGPRPIVRFTMLKTGAVTHGFNTDQRFLDVPFVRQGGDFRLTVTADPVDATPGYYMLFAFDDRGTPSIAKMMRIPSPTADNGQAPPASDTPVATGSGTGGATTVAGATTGGAASTSGTGTGANPSTPSGSALAAGLQTPLVAAHSKLCLTVQGNAADNGAAIVQAACNGSAAQNWTLVSAGSGYLVKNVASNRCLDVYGAGQADGTKIVQWDCHGNANQIWQARQTATGTALAAMHSDKCLDVTGAQTAPGTPVIQWTCNSQTHQAWSNRVSAGGTTAPATPAASEPALAAGRQTPLVAGHSKLCLAVEGNSAANGAAVVQAACDGSAAQNWAVVSAGSGYLVKNAASNRCLDVNGAGQANGTKIIQWDCHGNANQIWQARQTAAGTSLAAMHSDKCLDVTGAQTAPGTPVIQWTCNSQAHQAWSNRGSAGVPVN